MKPNRACLVLVTAPDLKTARRLAQAVLQNKLAACANLVPKIESHYWWNGKIESSPEILLIFKTDKSCLAPLEKMVVANHPYDTPEFLLVKISGGNRRYLKWISDSLS